MRDRQDSDLQRRLPAVGKLLAAPSLGELQETLPRSLVVNAVRQVLEEMRTALRDGWAPDAQELSNDAIADRARDRALAMAMPSMRPAINATGVVLHTGLGRAVLPEPTVRAVEAVASGHSNLEIDPVSNVRRERNSHLEALLRDLTGAEAGFVVNNNAAAVLLALNTLASGREVIVSRGQLVEIGGSFRLPDIMSRAGVQLVEVGTTNRTRLSDYENAISDDTALILRVHRSNFRMIGFTSDVPLRDLVALGTSYAIPVVEDAGSGALIDLSEYGLGDEPLIPESISAGVDVVTFSGDKLLGGPQAGIIIGSREHVEAMAANPLARALRIDKLTVAALESTLRLYADTESLPHTVPALRYIMRPLQDIDRAARSLRRRLLPVVKQGAQVSIVDGVSEVGGGTMPGAYLPTKLVSIALPGMSSGDLAKEFRAGTPPVFGRVAEERLVLDLRTVQDIELPLLARVARKILSSTS